MRRFRSIAGDDYDAENIEDAKVDVIWTARSFMHASVFMRGRWLRRMKRAVRVYESFLYDTEVV